MHTYAQLCWAPPLHTKPHPFMTSPTPSYQIPPLPNPSSSANAVTTKHDTYMHEHLGTFCDTYYVRVSQKRGNSAHFQNFKIKNNFDVIVGMNLKLVIIILHSLTIPSSVHFLCGCSECAYYPWSKVSRFIPPVWLAPLLTGGYLKLWDLWSRRPDVPLNQE